MANQPTVQPPSIWPLSLPATQHMRSVIVVSRDEARNEFAIRGVHGGAVIDLTLQEAQWLRQIRISGVKEVLQSQFGSISTANDLKQLVDLILRLHENALLEPVAHGDLMQSIETLAAQTIRSPVSEHSRRKVGTTAPSFFKATFARLFAHPLTAVAAVAALISLLIATSKGHVLTIETALSIMDKPAVSLVKLWFGILAASTLYSVAGAHLTWASLPPMLRGDPQFKVVRRAWAFLVCEFDSHGIDLLTRTAELRVRGLCLIIPWIGCCLAALAGENGSHTMHVLALSFAIVGLAEINPSDRGQLVALMEAWVREPDLLEKTKGFLSRGLLRFDQKATIGEGILSSVMMLWLTGLTMVTGELLNSSVLTLGSKVAELDFSAPGKAHFAAIGDQVAAIAWLMIMFATVIGGIFKLVAIPFQNFISLATLPIKALRPSALLHLDRTMNPEAFRNVISNLPVFANCGPETLERIINAPKFHQCRKGQVATRDVANLANLKPAMLVVLEGQLSGSNEPVTYTAGDCLLSVSSDPVIAKTNAVLLEIDEETLLKATPQMVEGGTIDHVKLVQTLRAIKLLQESAALSYLTPKQTSALAFASTFKQWQAGETLIQQGAENAESAYLIESGAVSISFNGRPVADNITRGGLVGTTALLQNSSRTANVVATTATVCLEISRKDFLEASSSNAVVAILLGKMTVEQLKSNNSAEKRGAA